MVTKKINTTLMNLGGGASLKFHVGLYDNNEEKPRDIIHTFNDEYVSISINAYATLEIKDFENRDWDPSRSVMITSNNISELETVLQRTIDNIYIKDTFEIIDGVTSISKKTIKERTEIGYLDKDFVFLHPSVIYDKQEDSYYEGATLYINKQANYVELHFSRLASLLRNVKQINFTTMALEIFQFYLSSGLLPDFYKKRTHFSTRKSMFDDVNEVSSSDNSESRLPSNKMDGFF